MKDCIAIIGAMDEEVQALSQSLIPSQEIETNFSNLPISSGTLDDQKVVIVRCGIGKVNAALATQYIIDRFRPKIIINSGVAGGLQPELVIGDVVIGTGAQHHDFDVRNFGHPKGTIPRLESSHFVTAPHLLEYGIKAATQVLGVKRVHQGLIVSGDQFISSREQKQEILRFFPTAFCAEMEGAAIAQVASLNKTAHLIVRAISDQADSTAPEDFDEYLLRIIPDLNNVIRRVLSFIGD